MTGVAEAVVLGFASGPVCVASCGPVLLPWLAAEPRGLRATGQLLGVFLGGRLAGYLAFAVIAWTAGVALPVDAATRTLIFGLANLGLGALLLVSAAFPRRHCPAAQAAGGDSLVQIGPANRFRPPAGLTLGFLTGLNLCPPFVAAGVRAAEERSLAGACLFFVLFFAGTTVWFLPSLAVSPLRRFEAVPFVARVTMAVLALYYAYLGVVSLSGWSLSRSLNHG
jgi:sulfite exporter TauE/SafE